MRKLSGWFRLGIVVSAMWAAFTTFIYVNEIVNYPSFAAKSALHGYFKWVDDPATTQKEAKTLGKEFAERYTFIKPDFKLAGYFQLAVVPIVIGWLGVYLLVWMVRWVRDGFRT